MTGAFQPSVESPSASERTIEAQPVGAAAGPLRPFGVALARRAGNTAMSQLLARAVDVSKVDPIKAEMDSFSTKTLGMTGALEDLWNGFGNDLPEAINHPSYRDLWFQSINTLKMSEERASRGLIATFGRDVKGATRDLASSRKTSLEALQARLEQTAKEKTSQQPKLVDDEQKQQTRQVGMDHVAVRDLIDTATLVDFLRNWDQLLSSAVVGGARDMAVQLPGSPYSGGGGGGGGGGGAGSDPFGLRGGGGGPAGGAATPGAGGFRPLLFRPGVTPEQLLQGVDGAVDPVRLAGVQKVYDDCTASKRDFAALADALVRSDANLAALDQAKDGLKAASGLRGSSDDQASSTLVRVTKENVAALAGLLDRLPNLDWSVLSVTQDLLLQGREPSASGVKWGGFVEKSFVQDHFRHVEAVNREQEQVKLALDLGIGAITLIALLSPAAPLAAGVLAAADAYGLARAAGDAADAKAADKHADAVSTAAGAGFASDAEAQAARKAAEEKNAGVAVNLLMAAMPYLGAAAGAGLRAAGGLRAGARFAAEGESATVVAESLFRDPRTVRTSGVVSGEREMKIGEFRAFNDQADASAAYWRGLKDDPTLEVGLWRDPRSRSFYLGYGEHAKVVGPEVTKGAPWELVLHHHPGEPVVAKLEQRLPSMADFRTLTATNRAVGDSKPLVSAISWADESGHIRYTTFGFDPAKADAAYWVRYVDMHGEVVEQRFAKPPWEATDYENWAHKVVGAASDELHGATTKR